MENLTGDDLNIMSVVLHVPSDLTLNKTDIVTYKRNIEAL